VVNVPGDMTISLMHAVFIYMVYESIAQHTADSLRATSQRLNHASSSAASYRYFPCC
jgi:hypothetical protein